MSLTPELLERLKAALAGAHDRTAAAEAAGVPRRTLFRWIERGQAEESGLYRELAEAAKIEPMELRQKRRSAGRIGGSR